MKHIDYLRVTELPEDLIQQVIRFDPEIPYCKNLLYSYGAALQETMDNIHALCELERLNDDDIRALRQNAKMLEYIFSPQGPELTGSVRAASSKRETTIGV